MPTNSKIPAATLPTRGTSAYASRAESVVVQIRDMILKGEFSPGYHMQEIPLAERLGVSRTPIREALLLLSMEGLLEAGPKRGYKVRSFTLADVVHAYEVRGTLEGMACRLHAERGITREMAQALQAVLDKGDAMLRQGMFDQRHQTEWSAMNNSFHDLLIKTVSNSMLRSCVSLVQNVPLSSARHVPWYKMDKNNFEIARGAHREHHEIVKAILAREGTRAEMLMREHVRFAQMMVQTHFKDQHISFGNTVTAGPEHSPR